MFAYRRKNRLGCEQLEGRFAPSSLLVGSGSRSSLHDAESLETTQAEQAAFYLAASAVLGQSSSMSKVAPVVLDQPALGNAGRQGDWWSPPKDDLQQSTGSLLGETAVVIPVFGLCMMPDGTVQCMQVGTAVSWTTSKVIVIDTRTESTDDGTILSVPTTDDSEISTDTASMGPISPETSTDQSNDAAAEDVEPVNQQPVGSDDPTVVNTHPVSESYTVTDDNVTDPMSVDNDPLITDASGGVAVDTASVEPQSDNAGGEGDGPMVEGRDGAAPVADNVSIDDRLNGS